LSFFCSEFKKENLRRKDKIFLKEDIKVKIIMISLFVFDIDLKVERGK